MLVALILLALACLVYLVGKIWLIVNAFRISPGWGFAVLLLGPIGSLVFRFNYREEARYPIYCGLASVLLFGGFKSMKPDKVEGGPLTAFMDQSKGKTKSPAADNSAEPKKPSTLPGMFAAQKKMELQIKLVALQRKSDELIERKAELAKGDRAGAMKLADEIKKYNEELKAVTQEMHDRGIETAQR